MAANGDFSDEDLSQAGSPVVEAQNGQDFDDQEPLDQPKKSAMKKSAPEPKPQRPELPPQSDPATLDVSTLTPLTPEVIARQATINIGTIGHVAHGTFSMRLASLSCGRWHDVNVRSLYRQEYRRKSYLRCPDCAIQERIGAKHYHQAWLRQRQDLQV